ncbi:MAG: tetratricopeptide (TPR) repeat protein [Flavobacterium sp.]|jgi:tetratricopeptide (TPR) repeat protein
MPTYLQATLLLLLACLLSRNLIAESSDNTELSKDLSTGLVLEGNGDYAQAIDAYRSTITLLENESGVFSRKLIEPLMGMARSEFSLSEYENTIIHLVRAQHLIHRAHGVYAERQQESIDLLIKTHIEMDAIKLADKQHKFKLFLSEHNVGADSIELLPALDIVNKWYVATGQLNRAKKSLQRTREIIRAQGDNLDSLQIGVLIELAEVRRLSHFCCSYKLLEEGLEIIEANPNLGNQNLSNQNKALYFLALADAYTIAGKVADAQSYYRKAWTLTEDINRHDVFNTPRGIDSAREMNNIGSEHSKIFLIERDRFGGRRFEEVSNKEKWVLDSLPPQTFRFATDNNAPKQHVRDSSSGARILEDKELRVIGYPYQFNREQLHQILPFSLHSDVALAKLKIELLLTVDAKGRTRQIRVLTPNIPTKLSRLMRDAVSRTYFRPRLEAGIPVTTRDFQIIQQFEL